MRNVRDMRSFFGAGVGALTRERARDLARSLLEGERSEQANRLAGELYQWSQRSREWLRDAVGQEVRRQLTSLGLATREDLDALRKRVRELEKRTPEQAKRPKQPRAKAGSATSARRRGSSTRATAAKRSATRRSSSRRTVS